MDRDQLRACSTDDLVASGAQIAAMLASNQAALLDVIAVLDEREVWHRDGCVSLVDWVAFQYQVSRKTAHEWVEAARALGDLPHLAEAFGSGELSWDKTRAVAAISSPEFDPDLTEEAKTTDVTRLETAARRARAVSREEAEARHRARFFSMRRSIKDGGVRLTGFLPDIDGETVIKAIERLADDVPKDLDTGVYPSFDERCADALVELASEHIATEQVTHGDRAMLVAHVDLGLTERAELEGKTVIALETAERIACDSTIEPHFERDGVPVGVGRRSRQVPAWLLRQLKERDLGCRFPGCTRTRLVNAHHMHHWAHGGATDRDNLVLLCRHHHRKLHEGGWSMRGDPEGVLEFTKPNGEVLMSPRMKIRPEIRQRLLGTVLPEGP